MSSKDDQLLDTLSDGCLVAGCLSFEPSQYPQEIGMTLLAVGLLDLSA